MEALKKLKNMCEKATSSPWYFSNHEEIRDIYHDDGHDTTCVIKEASEAIEDEDARFIVVARQALPILIELVEAQSSYMDKIKLPELNLILPQDRDIMKVRAELAEAVISSRANLESLVV